MPGIVLVRVGDILPSMSTANVRAKVVWKDEVQNTSPGSLSEPFYKILLWDETGPIYLFVYLHPKPPMRANPEFTQQMRRIVDALVVGKLYTFEARVRNFQPEYTTQNHSNGAELLFHNMVEDNEVGHGLEDVRGFVPFQFSNAQVVNDTDVAMAVDVLGTVVRVHNADEGPDELRRFIELQIMGGQFDCNVWRRHEERFLVNAVPFRVAIQGAKVTRFDDQVQLNIGNTATVYMAS
ncbi:hypothetical protein Fcan01_23860 [Folsomia candida]|uniref:Uncharacterized protein n=1 Tax=Folsomia candida TaxID=158441 RepID=A0A226D8V2_FOLCA|nr:hypothetical protein Fcan01_23860 [Folsomia candida]